MGRTTRASAGLCLGLLAVLLGASSAGAHGDYVSSDPAKGDRLDEKPQHVEIVLNEAPVESSNITVLDGCGRDVTQASYVDDRSIHAVPEKSASKGRWRVEYAIVSAGDGHRTEGSFGFRVKGRCSEDGDDGGETAPADGADGDGAAAIDPEPSVEIQEEGGPPIVLLAVAGMAVVGIALLARRGGA